MEGNQNFVAMGSIRDLPYAVHGPLRCIGWVGAVLIILLRERDG